MWNATPSLCLNGFVGTCKGWTDKHNDTGIVFFSAFVTFLGLSHMCYCSETRDMKTAIRGRFKLKGQAGMIKCN